MSQNWVCAYKECPDQVAFLINPGNRLDEAAACWSHLPWAMTLVGAPGMTMPVKVL